MRKRLTDYSDDPLYNMKAVEQQTGISAATLRAWERRYTLVEPKRTASGYRLYSDRDVALLRWVRRQMDEGMTISRVVAMLEGVQTTSDALWVEAEEDATFSPTPDAPTPPMRFIMPLYEALTGLDSERADDIIEQAFAIYTLTTVCMEIIVPTLIEIGEAMHNGQISISTEHFASTYLRGRLYGLFRVYPHHHDMPMIMVGCAPGEHHEIGALIFALMLRQSGYNVIYLGQDVPADDFVQTAISERPALVCLSANNETSAAALRNVQRGLEQGGTPVPIFCYGGRAFDYNNALRDAIPGHYLGTDPRQAVSLVGTLLRGGRVNGATANGGEDPKGSHA
ncbi:MAG TPA: MerR family transcriptional regulator [Aggregatilineales bacterium]|nr:MerR family transcriptional regulator [Anaerolineales bacterium]HRE47739.1 MerR family transcriptional regulator [Aggregatilineales bacterium]